MTKYELGTKAGEIAVRLHKENVVRHTALGKRYSVFAKYLTGSVTGGVYPFPKVYVNMEKYCKTEKTQELLNQFVRDVAEAGVTKTSFYPCAGWIPEEEQEYPYIGEDFSAGFWDAIGRQASI